MHTYSNQHPVAYRVLQLPSCQMLPVDIKSHSYSREVFLWPAGWRRFQSLPMFATEDANGRHRMLKYTPEHMHCLAAVWGPLAPPNTGVIAIQNPSNDQQVRMSVEQLHMYCFPMCWASSPCRAPSVTSRFNKDLEWLDMHCVAAAWPCRAGAGIRGYCHISSPV